jgi:arylformamidase
MNLEAEYDNRARVPDHQSVIDGWQAAGENYRAEAASRAEIDVVYGARPRNRLDIFHAPVPKRDAPLAVFIHGGYWRSLDKHHFSQLAAPANAAGYDVAVPTYTLCPEVTVPEIIDELRQALLFLWNRMRRSFVVCGHSAGGHLAACMAATDWPSYGATAQLVSAGFGISGLYDLRPLMGTSINDTLRLTETQALVASPLLWPAPKAGRFDAWVGAEESAEFIRQSRSLQAAWSGVGRKTSCEEIAGANHFTVVNGLADPASPLSQNFLALLGT